MTEKNNPNHESGKTNNGHRNGNPSYLGLVFISGSIAVAGLLVTSIWWPNLTERTKFFTGNLLNLVIALAVVAQVLIYRKQRDIMKQQWQAMNDGLERTDQVIENMQGQLTVIETQAGFMEAQTEAALKAADMAMGQLIMMQRQEQAQHAGEAPYFGILGTPDIKGIEPGRTPKVSIIFMNGGRTPAWHFNAIACLVLGDSPKSPDHWFISPTSMGTFYHREAHKSVDFTETDLSFSEKQVADINNGATSLFLIVTITYKDIRDQLCPSRTFIFCYDRKRKYFADYQIT